MPGSQRRRRRTDAQVEAERLARSIALTMGGEAKRTRRTQRRTQRHIADDLGIDPSRLSQIERGRGENVPLELWVALGIALRRPLAVSFSKGLDPEASVVDAGHLEIQEALLAFAAATKPHAEAELPTRPSDPRHSTDVVVRDDRHRTLILHEAWNTFGDVGAAIRSTHRKQAEVEERAVVVAGAGSPFRVATVWVVRASATNRALIDRYPHLFAATFIGSSRGWVRAISSGEAPPLEPGLVWFDPATRRILEWRRRPG